MAVEKLASVRHPDGLVPAVDFTLVDSLPVLEIAGGPAGEEQAVPISVGSLEAWLAVAPSWG